mmetsp:Transcript_71808/g.126806  ORF Transcript_71808/g.126806 Transcript_71808/m.126806 type:complete len:267 (-) Transcript_71808:700-1500(-)
MQRVSSCSNCSSCVLPGINTSSTHSWCCTLAGPRHRQAQLSKRRGNVTRRRWWHLRCSCFRLSRHAHATLELVDIISCHILHHCRLVWRKLRRLLDRRIRFVVRIWHHEALVAVIFGKDLSQVWELLFSSCRCLGRFCIKLFQEVEGRWTTEGSRSWCGLGLRRCFPFAVCLVHAAIAPRRCTNSSGWCPSLQYSRRPLLRKSPLRTLLCASRTLHCLGHSCPAAPRPGNRHIGHGGRARWASGDLLHASCRCWPRGHWCVRKSSS